MLDCESPFDFEGRDVSDVKNDTEICPVYPIVNCNKTTIASKSDQQWGESRWLFRGFLRACMELFYSGSFKNSCFQPDSVLGYDKHHFDLFLSNGMVSTTYKGECLGLLLLIIA